MPSTPAEARPGGSRGAHGAGDGWASKRNGELLRLAERELDVFLTVDRKLRSQQNLAAFNIAVIVMVATTNTLLDLRPLIPRVLQTLADAKRGKATVVGE
jgi:hypothetical protein